MHQTSKSPARGELCSFLMRKGVVSAPLMWPPFSPSTVGFGVVGSGEKRGGNCEGRVSLASQAALQLLAQVTPRPWAAGAEASSRRN